MAEIVLFGSSGGIGQHLVETMGDEHEVFGSYLTADADELDTRASYHRVDVTDSGSVQDFASSISDRLERPVLIYTPGISPNAMAHKFSDEAWHRTLATNLTGAMYAMRAFLPRMRELGFGRIILFSSVLAGLGVPGTIAYSASKAGLSAMARVASTENATKGVTVNALALGYFSVGIIKAVPKKYLDEAVIPGIPQGRLGDPADIVVAVRFIIEADYMTGATLDINGGMFGA